MDVLITGVEFVVNTVNEIVWGPPMLFLLVFTGIFLSIRTGFPQLTRFGHMLRETLLAIFKKKHVRKTKEAHAISQFQSLSTALAATIGTGNIVGVAGAIAIGGPGAVFWMWVSAFFGMITNFSENVLGIFYRERNAAGEWAGGAMMYLEKGLGQRWLAVLFSLFCLLASFGIGNLSQINSISTSLEASLSIPTWVTGIVAAILVGIVILGGIKRIAAVTEKFVPFMALLYLAGGLTLILLNVARLPSALGQIFSGAFSLESVGGGIMGTVMAQAIRYGVARGVFSNEAGLGSSVMVHSASDVREPVTQGLWGIFEIFTDTIVVCTITALSILTVLPMDAITSMDSAKITATAFTTVFGNAGGIFVSVSIALFAFSTILGWSYYGQRAIEYLGGLRAVKVYKVIFLCVIVLGAVSSVELAWDISEAFNGLMALPNLVGVLALSPVVVRVTRNYFDRNFRGLDVPPLLNHLETPLPPRKR